MLLGKKIKCPVQSWCKGLIYLFPKIYWSKNHLNFKLAFNNVFTIMLNYHFPVKVQELFVVYIFSSIPKT